MILARYLLILPLLLSAGSFVQPVQQSPPHESRAGDASPSKHAEPPAEERRLNVVIFREGLRRLGLTEILEQHLHEFPPSNPIATKLLLRDARLAAADDENRTPVERHQALMEANKLLGEVIAEAKDDPRRFQWRFDLAHSLVYDEAEPYFTNILYRGGTEQDRTELAERTGRALAALDRLIEELSAEYERIDQMSIAEFERVERTGYVAAVDALAPRAEYLRLWTWFYDSLARGREDPQRLTELTHVLQGLEREGTLLETDHMQSRVQVQALLLAGMAARRINDPAAARSYLDRAVRVADKLSDEEERDRVAWAVTLARLERVRTERDDGKFDAALRELDRLREQIGRDESPATFGLVLVAALEERNTYRDRAAVLSASGRSNDARKARRESWLALERVARRSPRHRNELYALVSGLVPSDATPASLDPFELAAVLAAALYEDGDATDDVRDAGGAVAVGKYFLEHAATDAPDLVPEVLFNLAAAEYHRGRLAAAAERLLTLVHDYPQFEHAQRAAVLAVELAGELRRDETHADREAVQTLYQSALETLVRGFAGTDAAEYWRFYLAQVYEQNDEFQSAAEEYNRVVPSHEYAEEARFRRLRCLALKLLADADKPDADVVAIRAAAASFLNLQRDYLQRATADAAESRGDDPSASRRMRLRLLTAEVHLLPQLDQARIALDNLGELEGKLDAEPELRARYWRARLLALEQLGRLDEAGRVVPLFVDADPVRAGATLQSLYDGLVERIDQPRADKGIVAAQRRADFLLLLARHIDAWVSRRDPAPDSYERRAAALQLAEAYLRAGKYQAAKERFSALVEHLAEGSASDDFRTRSELGLAESLYRLDDYAAALPIFNRWVTALPDGDPRRWQALLRDLQCRTTQGQDPRDVLKVIRQQRYLYPDMGGNRFRSEFDRLERENQRRLDTR
ncbi:MAG: tetratricopeptide repeat protein [Phycisphaerae bacterium]|nr:tetratricopeptide repeat protein [Phycisphaerae bacterium]